MPMVSSDKEKTEQVAEEDQEVKIYDGHIKKPTTEKNKTFLASLEFALQGLKTVIQEERNMRTHLLLGAGAIILGILFRLKISEWLWLALAIFLVLVMEIINTSFENVVDMVTDFHFHPIGKKIKDMAAGAVLLTAWFAVFVGALLFVPKILHILQGWLNG